MQTTRALITHDSLLERGRTGRPPLRVWARDVLKTLRAPSAKNGDTWRKIALCMNQGALIEVYRGHRQSAKALCELQLRWVQNLCVSDGTATTGDLAFQPWVNLGRLLRMEGDFAGACERFALIRDLEALREVQLGPVSITPATWRALVDAKPTLPSFLEAVHVVDSVKTYLMAQNHMELLEFISSCRTAGFHPGLPFLDEAEIIVLTRLGRYGDALAVTERDAWGVNGYSKVVAQAFQVALFATSGDAQRAREGVASLTQLISAATAERIRDHRVLRYLYQLGSSARYLGMEDTARSIYDIGLRGARRFVDEPLEFSFLEALIELSTSGDKVSLEDARTALLRDCLNMMVLGPRGCRPAPAIANDPVFGELRHTLEEIAQA